jgi:hypothetical protein
MGQLIINHDELDRLNYHDGDLHEVIQNELAREW